MATDTQTIDRIKRLRANAKAMGGFFDTFEETIKHPTIDKHGAGFGADSRFSSFAVSTSFDNWTGQYGSSSCGRLLSVDQELVKPFITKALNVHKQAIFATIADLMNAEAASLTGQARAEISALQALMDSVDAAIQSESSPLEASVSVASKGVES